MIYPISLSRALEVSWRTHMPSGTTRRSRVVTPKTTRSPWQSWPRAWRPSVNRDWEEPGWQFDINNFGLNFSLKNNFSFGSRFPTYTKKSSKQDSLGISQYQNGNSSRFSSRNSSQKCVYWIATKLHGQELLVRHHRGDPDPLVLSLDVGQRHLRAVVRFLWQVISFSR